MFSGGIGKEIKKVSFRKIEITDTGKEGCRRILTLEQGVTSLITKSNASAVLWGPEQCT